MLLAVCVMNMVYLTSETRVRIEEPGINDPSIKLLVTIFTFAILYLLQQNLMLDPSKRTDAADNATVVVVDWTDYHLPLPGVCGGAAPSGRGPAVWLGALMPPRPPRRP